MLDVFEVSAKKGDWIVPAVKEVSLAQALSDCVMSSLGPRGARAEEIRSGTVAICEFNKTRNFVLRDPASFGIVLLRNEALEEVRQESRQYLGAELQPHNELQDPTLKHLMGVLLREKRDGFQSGSLFLDGMASAIASYLLGHYSNFPPVRENATGGIAPASLRRCIEFIEAHLAGEIRLDALAREANLSSSHFIRSFRRSTGKTPHQFLLERRVSRAKRLMSQKYISLTEVALASGFADQHHLARVFRRVTGVAPSHFRRSL